MLEILSLELVGYRRLLLSNIKSIVYKPTKPFQLILGTNGCGKSSILHALSPLPANPADYLENGMKKVVISFNNRTYTLISTFGKHRKHEFILENENLNPGGTISIQKQLVKDTFGITPEIHDLLTDKIRFTDLSPIKRREWFTKLSTIDYTYAIGVYNSFLKSLRDTQGALKHVRGRLINETDKLSNLDSVEDIESKYNKLLKEVDLIHSLRVPNLEPSDKLKSEIKTVTKEIVSISESILTSIPEFSIPIKDFKTLESLIADCKTEIEVTSEVNNGIMRSITETDDLLAEFTSLGVANIDDLKVKHKELTDELSKLKSKLIKYHDFKGNPLIGKRALYEIKSDLISVLETLPEDPNRELTNSTLENTQQEIRTTGIRIQKLERSVDKDANRLNHLNSLVEQQCPKCEHKFTPGRKEQEIEFLKSELDKNSRLLKQLQQKLEDLNALATKCESYKRQMGILSTLSTQSLALKEFWDTVIRTKNIFINPRGLINEIYTLESDLEYLVPISELERKRESMESLMCDVVGLEKIKSLTLKRDKLNAECEVQIRHIGDLHKRLALLKKYKTEIVNLDKQYAVLEAKVLSIKTLHDDAIESMRSEALSSALRRAQTELALHQHTLSEKKALVSIIGDLEKDSKRLELELEGLKEITKVLSPNDGLIAAQLKNFINCFVGDINKVINDIWCYDLDIMPSGTGINDLDYKFLIKTRLNGIESGVDDIANGSEAQVDIINFAFKLVAMSYLGLEHYPIYLDEFSSSFDEQHRENGIYFIKTLLEGNNFSQLFMISHFASQFGAFNNVETLVLNDTNIVTPKEYNTHAVIK